MIQKILVLITLIMILALSACSAGDVTALQTETAVTGVPAAALVTTVTETAAAAVVTPRDTHDKPEDLLWEPENTVSISFNGSAITVDSDTVSVDGAVVTIKSGGTYSLNGLLTDGQVVVDSADDEIVQLVLNDVTITNSSSAAIYISDADKAVIILADGTKNYLADGSDYVYQQADQDEPNAALFSDCDLTIAGSGELTVMGNYNDGIASKDGLVIESGSVTVTAVDDGIRGKDYILVKQGSISINAGGDGLKSDNEDDASKGWITIQDGTFEITSGGDGITALTAVGIAGGEFAIKTGTSEMTSGEEITSAKGIKAAASLQIDGGIVTITALDDGLHSNGTIAINDGSVEIESGDDGMHADAELTINSGKITITESYEGIESAVITLNGGEIAVTASDDGINVSGGVDGSGMMGPAGRPGAPGVPGAPGAMPPGFPGGTKPDAFAANTDYYLYINGGSMLVDAQGDGLDINGAIKMTGGTVIIHGPSEQMNGALDYDAGFEITGGLLVAAGSSGMAQAPDSSSSQNSVLVNLTATQQAGSLFNIRSSAGEDLLTLAPLRDYQSVVLSSPELASGGSYTIYLGGSAADAVTGGLYSGAYTPGSQYEQFTVTDVVTLVGTIGRGGMRRP